MVESKFLVVAWPSTMGPHYPWCIGKKGTCWGEICCVSSVKNIGLGQWEGWRCALQTRFSDIFMCICDACYDLCDTFQSFFTNFFVREELLVVFVHESSTIYACICQRDVYALIIYIYIYIHIIYIYTHMIILYYIHLMHLLLQCK